MAEMDKNPECKSKKKTALQQRERAVVAFTPSPEDTAYKAPKKAEFLKAFATFGTITPAAQSVNLDPSTVYRWRHEDAEFEKAFEMVDQNVTDRLEERAIARALVGEDGPSASLLIFLVKCRNKRYRERIIQEIDPKTIDFIVAAFIESIRNNVPEFCPHCKTHLQFTDEISRELGQLSAKFVSGS